MLPAQRSDRVRRSDAVAGTLSDPVAASSQVNTKDITELEKFVKDAKPRFLFYKDGAAPTNQPKRIPSVSLALGCHLLADACVPTRALRTR